MRIWLFLFLFAFIKCRRGGGGRGSSRGSSSRGSSSIGKSFSKTFSSIGRLFSSSRSSGKTHTSSGYSWKYPIASSSSGTSGSTSKNVHRSVDQYGRVVTRARDDKWLALAESYAYGGSNYGKNSKPSSPSVSSSISKAYLFNGAPFYSDRKMRESNDLSTDEKIIILSNLNYRRKRKAKKPDWDTDFDFIFEDDDGIYLEYEGSGTAYRTYIEKESEPCLTILFVGQNREYSCWVDIIFVTFLVVLASLLALIIWYKRQSSERKLTFD